MIRKTATITAASIAGIVLAGGAAVGANIGILNSSDDDVLGQLSAEVQPVAADTATTTPAADPASTETYTVDAAGVVTVRTGGDRLDVDEITTNDGWSWEEVDHTDSVLWLAFRRPASGEVLDFVVRRVDTGEVVARVDRRSTPEATAAAPPDATGTTPGTPTYDDLGSVDRDDDHDEYDDDEYDDEYDEDEHEHEGWDSDD